MSFGFTWECSCHKGDEEHAIEQSSVGCGCTAYVSELHSGHELPVAAEFGSKCPGKLAGWSSLFRCGTAGRQDCGPGRGAAGRLRRGRAQADPRRGRGEAQGPAGAARTLVANVGKHWNLAQHSGP